MSTFKEFKIIGADKRHDANDGRYDFGTKISFDVSDKRGQIQRLFNGFEGQTCLSPLSCSNCVLHHSNNSARVSMCYVTKIAPSINTKIRIKL